MSGIRLRISVIHLPPEGEVLGGELPLAGLLGPDGHDPRVQCPFPMVYDLRVSPVRGGIVLRGTLSTVVMAECDRCLERYRLVLDGVEVCRFYEMPESGVLDLTEDVREDMVFAFPDHFLCRADCRGLCPICGQDLNHGKCACTPAPAPPSREDVWSVLDRFHSA